MVLLRSTPFVQDGMRATQRRSILESLANEQGPQLDPMRNANFSDGSGIDPQGEGFDPYNTTPPVRPPLDMTTLRPEVQFSPIEKRPFTPVTRDPSLEKKPSFLDTLAADLEMAIPGMHGIMSGARYAESMMTPPENPPAEGGGALQDALARMRGSFGDARKSWSAGMENIKNAGDAPMQAMERARSTVSEASANLDNNPYWNPPDGFYELMKAKGSEAYKNLSGSLSQGAENFRQARYAPGLAMRRADDTIKESVANLEKIASVNDGSVPGKQASPTIANIPVANTIPVAPADRPPQAGPARLNTGPVPMAPLAQLAAEQADMSMPGNMAHTLRIQNGPFESSVNYVNGKAQSLGAPGRAGVDVPSGDDMTLARLQRELFGQQERDLNKQETGYEDVPGARRLASMLNPQRGSTPENLLESLMLTERAKGTRQANEADMLRSQAEMRKAIATEKQAGINQRTNDLGVNQLINDRIKDERAAYVGAGGNLTTWTTVEEPRRRIEMAKELKHISDERRGVPSSQTGDQSVGPMPEAGSNVSPQQGPDTIRTPADAAAEARAASVLEKNPRPGGLAEVLTQADINNPAIRAKLAALLSQGDPTRNRKLLYGQMAALAASGGQLPGGFSYERDAESPFTFFLNQNGSNAPVSSSVSASSLWPFGISGDHRTKLTEQINILAALAQEMEQRQQNPLPGGQR